SVRPGGTWPYRAEGGSVGRGRDGRLRVDDAAAVEGTEAPADARQRVARRGEQGVLDLPGVATLGGQQRGHARDVRGGHRRAGVRVVVLAVALPAAGAPRHGGDDVVAAGAAEEA